MSFDLKTSEGRVLITGAAVGLGRGFAEVFGEAGYRVALVDRNLEAAQKTADELKESGIEALALEADVTRSEDVARVFEEVGEQWSGIDVVINNAGILGPAKAIEDLSDEDLDQVLDVDLKGPFLVCREAVKVMRAGGKGGSILNISSITADTGAAVYPAYSAAKAGVIGLTRSMARRCGRYGIRVNCLRPGSILGTRFLETSRGSDLNLQERLKLKMGLMQKIPIGRAAESRDIANFALFLASPLAKHIHGAILTVDGGEALGSQ